MTDWMEYGETGWVALSGGWMQDTGTGNKKDPQGRIYNGHGMIIWDPAVDGEEEYPHQMEFDFDWGE